MPKFIVTYTVTGEEEVIADFHHGSTAKEIVSNKHTQVIEAADASSAAVKFTAAYGKHPIVSVEPFK